MQTLICGLIILAAAWYVINRWMPGPMKQRILQMLGKSPKVKTEAASGSCGSCSSCGNCVSDSVKMVKK
jgi:hypothetical protein